MKSFIIVLAVLCSISPAFAQDSDTDATFDARPNDTAITHAFYVEPGRYYLQRNDGSISDDGNYSTKPPDRDDGTWILGAPPKGSQTISKKWEQEARAAQANEVAKMAEMEARITALEERLKGQ